MNALKRNHKINNKTNCFIAILLLFLTLQHPTTAEKKYIFKKGSRQAVEVDANDSRQSKTYRKTGRVIKRGMTRRPYRARVKTPSPTKSKRSTYSTSSRANQKKSYHYTDHVTVDKLNRTFYVFVPSSYSNSRSTPVLLVFHGLGMSAVNMTAITGFNGVASRNNFIVVYCQSVSKRWNDGMNNTKGVNDVKYVQAVLKKLSTRLNISQRRIYACGLSNGGYFCQLLASAMPDRIAGIAVVGSTVMRQALSKSGKPIPCLFFFGSEDPLINWSDGGKRDLGKYGKKLGFESIDPNFYKLARYGGWMSVEDLVSYWVSRNRCSNSPRTTMLPDKVKDDGMRVQLKSYGSAGNAVHVYKIIGGTHSWPGALLLPGVKAKSCQDISASEVIWDFFKRYAR